MWKVSHMILSPSTPNTHEGSSIALFMQVPLIIDEFWLGWRDTSNKYQYRKWKVLSNWIFYHCYQYCRYFRTQRQVFTFFILAGDTVGLTCLTCAWRNLCLTGHWNFGGCLGFYLEGDVCFWLELLSFFLTSYTFSFLIALAMVPVRCWKVVVRGDVFALFQILVGKCQASHH